MRKINIGTNFLYIANGDNNKDVIEVIRDDYDKLIAFVKANSDIANRLNDFIERRQVFETNSPYFDIDKLDQAFYGSSDEPKCDSLKVDDDQIRFNQWNQYLSAKLKESAGVSNMVVVGRQISLGLIEQLKTMMSESAIIHHPNVYSIGIDSANADTDSVVASVWSRANDKVQMHDIYETPQSADFEQQSKKMRDLFQESDFYKTIQSMPRPNLYEQIPIVQMRYSFNVNLSFPSKARFDLMLKDYLINNIATIGYKSWSFDFGSFENMFASHVEREEIDNNRVRYYLNLPNNRFLIGVTIENHTLIIKPKRNE
jgi:hypothetical protein